MLNSASPEIVQFVQPGLAVSLGPGWVHLLDCFVWWYVTCFQQRPSGLPWGCGDGWGRALPQGELPLLAEVGSLFLWATGSPAAAAVQAGRGQRQQV